MKNNIVETIITLCLILLTVLLLNPFHFWMPDMVVMVVLACSLVLFAVFASYILREKIVDERDVLHSNLAGRNAFLAGSAILMVGIVIEGHSHNVDPWLVIGLITMIITKIVTRIWSDRNL